MTDQPAPIGHNHPPKAAFATAPRQCMECGELFRGKTSRGMFCSPQHQQDFHNRSSKLGRALMPLLKARLALKGKAHPLNDEHHLWALCDQLLRDALNEDRAAGRPSAVDYVATKAQLFGLDPRASL